MCASRESILVCLTNLFTEYPPMPPKLNRKRALFVLTKIDEILAWEKQKEAERDTRFVDLGQVSVRGAGGTVLAGGEPEVVRRVSGKTVSGIEKEGVLPDVHPRAPAAAGEEGAEGSGMDEGAGVGEGGAQGRAATSIVQPGCTKRAKCRRRTSGGRWRRS